MSGRAAPRFRDSRVSRGASPPRPRGASAPSPTTRAAFEKCAAGRAPAAPAPAPGQPAYILGGIQINGPTEGPELLAIRHFELRAPDGTLTDKMAALERALDLQVNGFN